MVPSAQAQTLRLPHETDSVAAIQCEQLLEHLVDPAGALSEMARVLRPGGLLSILPAGASEQGYYRGFTDAWYSRQTLAAGLRVTASGPHRIEAVKCRPAEALQTLIDSDTGCVMLYAEAATAEIGAAHLPNARRYYEDGCELDAAHPHLNDLHHYFKTAGMAQ